MSLSFLQSAVDGANATEYTFSSQNLGTAAADRYIILGVTSRSAGTTNTINSVTIGGVTATEIQLQRTVTTVTNMAGLYIAAVPTGTTGDIVVTFDAETLRIGIGAWRAVNLVSATPTDSGKSGADAPTFNIDVNAGGFAIGVCYGANDGTTPSVAWTGITERYDQYSEGANINSGASETFVSAQVNLTITATITAPDTGVSAGAFGSWAIAASGPANLKTLDTNVKANIKTYNTNPLANIKSINTNV